MSNLRPAYLCGRMNHSAGMSPTLIVIDRELVCFNANSLVMFVLHSTPTQLWQCLQALFKVDLKCDS